jgi:hypothetical protein
MCWTIAESTTGWTASRAAALGVRSPPVQVAAKEEGVGGRETAPVVVEVRGQVIAVAAERFGIAATIIW